MYNSLGIPEMTPQELVTRLAESEPVQLIDVREPSEIRLAAVPGFEVLPLSEHANWSGQIRDRFDPECETVVMCHHGMRSAQMCLWLKDQGFADVKNLTGGIDAYAVEVDPSIGRY